MKRNMKPAKIKTSKSTINFQYPVPVNLIDEYLNKLLPFHAVITKVEVKFAVLNDDEYDLLHEACMEECYPSARRHQTEARTLSLEQLKLGMK